MKNTPEHNLWTAVIKEAIHDYLSKYHIPQVYRDSAESFLFDKTQDGFDTICFYLNINANTIRKAVLQKKKELYKIHTVINKEVYTK